MDISAAPDRGHWTANREAVIYDEDDCPTVMSMLHYRIRLFSAVCRSAVCRQGSAYHPELAARCVQHPTAAEYFIQCREQRIDSMITAYRSLLSAHRPMSCRTITDTVDLLHAADPQRGFTLATASS
ncbi:MAG TPA: hypothetical protein VIR60_01245 [Gammaproteobacteria bacterium]